MRFTRRLTASAKNAASLRHTKRGSCGAIKNDSSAILSARASRIARYTPIKLGLSGTPSALKLAVLHTMAHEAEPTIISAIMLSDLAIVEHGTQKRSLIGTFDQFGFHQFPAQYGKFFITASVTNIEGTFSKLELTYRIEKRGHVVFSNSTTIQFNQETQIARDNVMGLSIGVQGVTFPEPGTYTVVVLLDGDEIGKRDFGVIQVPQQ